MSTVKKIFDILATHKNLIIKQCLFAVMTAVFLLSLIHI